MILLCLYVTVCATRKAVLVVTLYKVTDMELVRTPFVQYTQLPLYECVTCTLLLLVQKQHVLWGSVISHFLELELDRSLKEKVIIKGM